MTSIDIKAAATNLLRNGEGAGQGRDPLPRLLAQLVERAGDPATVERAVSRPWASALFQGRRHIIALSLTGHFVADISIDDSYPIAGGKWIELSALTIEDW